MNLTEAADYVRIVSIDPAMSLTPARRARLGEVEDAMRAAVAPEVVAAAFGVTDPEEPIDGEGGWMPATSQLLRNLAEHGLKVMRA